MFNPSILPAPGTIPSLPGVYRFVDSQDRVIYIGKAKSLNDRLQSYFSHSQSHPRTLRMLSEAYRIEWSICPSEREALLLEQRLVKSLQPKYNVKLKDGDGYKGIFISGNDEFPAIKSWRRKNDKGEFFGPYPGINVYDLIDVLGRVYGVRSCNDKLFRERKSEGKACLLGETGRCLAPCIGNVSLDEYSSAVNNVKNILYGKDKEILSKLKLEMSLAADELNYELAQKRKEELSQLSLLAETQLSLPLKGKYDFINLAYSNEIVSCSLVRVYDGEIINIFRKVTNIDHNVSFDDFCEQVCIAMVTADDIILNNVGNITLIHDLTYDFSFRVSDIYKKVRNARGGSERQALALATLNAEEALSTASLKTHFDFNKRESLMSELAEFLGVPSANRIECIDISHTQGVEPVGSLVVMVDGEMIRNQYRKIKIPKSLGGDDYASIYHVVSKRLKGLGLPALPNILVIDGGKGQLAAALEAVNDFSDSSLITNNGMIVVSLAKRLEEVYTNPNSDPVLIGSVGPVVILQQVRDEAHRFALTNHRRYREKALLQSKTLHVPGVSSSRIKAILSEYSISELKKMSINELSNIDKIGKKTAARIYSYLKS